jgi:hypothetical protein
MCARGSATQRSDTTVSPVGGLCRWRKMVDVKSMNNPRSHELVKESVRAGGAAMNVEEWTGEEAREKSRLAKELELVRRRTHAQVVARPDRSARAAQLRR